MPDNPLKNTNAFIFISLWSLATLIVAGVTVLGGKFASSTWTQTTVQGTKCVDSAKRGWYFPNGPHRCLNALDATKLQHPRPAPHPDTTHYAFQVPTGNETGKSFSRWQWSLYGVLHLSLLHNNGYWSGQRSTLMVVARLGHGSNIAPHNTTLMAQGYQEPPVYCSNIQYHTLHGHKYDCASTVVMMLHSLHHPTYLLNLLLPSQHSANPRTPGMSVSIGHVKGVYVTFYSMSERYVQALMILKAMFFPLVGLLLWRFRQGVKSLSRHPTHLECCIAVLAVSLTLRNCPAEVVALVADFPWLVIVNDVRRNLFYAAFMAFFVYLTEKHTGTKGVWFERSTQTLNISLGCGVLAVAAVEVTTHVGSLLHPLAPSHPPIHLALFLLMLVMLAAFLVAQTLRTCSALEALWTGRVDEGGWKAGVMLVLTWLTCFLTGAEFIINKVQEGVWAWGGLLGDVQLEESGGFLLGVYSLWNTFTATLLVLFTPSTKPQSAQGCSEDNRVVGVPLRCRHSPSFLDLTVTKL